MFFFTKDAQTSVNFGQRIMQPIDSWKSAADTWDCATDTCKSADTTICDPYRQIIYAQATQVGCSAVKCQVGTQLEFIFACAFDKSIKPSPDSNLLSPSGSCVKCAPSEEPEQTFTVQFSISADISTFDSNAKQQFITGLAKVVKVSTTKITIVSVTAGSVQATVTVVASPSKMNNLNQQSLSNLGVVDYSVANNSANAPFYQSTLFIVLICVGTVVVAGIIVTIIVLFGIRKRNARKEKERLEGTTVSLLGDVDDDQLMNYVTQDIY